MGLCPRRCVPHLATSMNISLHSSGPLKRVSRRQAREDAKLLRAESELMTTEIHRSPARAALDGAGLTCEKVRSIARDGEGVAVAGVGLERARVARDAVHAIMATQPVYGRTTGVGANRSIQVQDGGHGLRLLRSHAGGAGPLLAAPLARGLLGVRLNQLGEGGSGVDPALLTVLAEVLTRGLIPPVRTVGAIGTGDLGALASTALWLIGERPWLGGLGATLPPFALDPADALAFMSSNAAPIGEAGLAAADLSDLIAATPVLAALSFLVVRR